jgi:hypothetical protein
MHLFLQAVTRLCKAPGKDEEKQANKYEKYVSHKCFERKSVRSDSNVPVES